MWVRHLNRAFWIKKWWGAQGLGGVREEHLVFFSFSWGSWLERPNPQSFLLNPRIFCSSRHVAAARSLGAAHRLRRRVPAPRSLAACSLASFRKNPGVRQKLWGFDRLIAEPPGQKKKTRCSSPKPLHNNSSFSWPKSLYYCKYLNKCVFEAKYIIHNAFEVRCWHLYIYNKTFFELLTIPPLIFEFLLGRGW